MPAVRGGVVRYSDSGTAFLLHEPPARSRGRQGQAGAAVRACTALAGTPSCPVAADAVPSFMPDTSCLVAPARSVLSCARCGSPSLIC